MRFHLDTDFLVYALSVAGVERRRLRTLADSDDDVQMSAVAWYEAGIPDLRLESTGPRSL